MIKQRVLIVEDDLNIQYSVKEHFAIIENRGYFILQKNNLEIHLTGIFEIANGLIKANSYLLYFLDNQIYSEFEDKKVLCQNFLIENILSSPNFGLAKKYIFNISSHANTTDLAKYLAGECTKSVEVILNTITDIIQGEVNIHNK